MGEYDCVCVVSGVVVLLFCLGAVLVMVCWLPLDSVRCRRSGRRCCFGRCALAALRSALLEEHLGDPWVVGVERRAGGVAAVPLVVAEEAWGTEEVAHLLEEHCAV